MNLELDVCELGRVLKAIEEKYDLDILVKAKLSGGWITMTGKATIEKYPDENAGACSGKKDNIIHIRIKENEESGILIKITGASDKKFLVDISSTRYKEISKMGLNLDVIKINKNESKFRIDENIIITIKASVEEIKQLINK